MLLVVVVSLGVVDVVVSTCADDRPRCDGSSITSLPLNLAQRIVLCSSGHISQWKDSVLAAKPNICIIKREVRDEHTNDVYATVALYVVIREAFCAHEPRGLWRVAIGVPKCPVEHCHCWWVK